MPNRECQLHEKRRPIGGRPTRTDLCGNILFQHTPKYVELNLRFRTSTVFPLPSKVRGRMGSWNAKKNGVRPAILAILFATPYTPKYLQVDILGLYRSPPMLRTGLLLLWHFSVADTFAEEK